MSLHARRHFLQRCVYAGTATLASPWFLTPGAFAEELARTPSMTEGPFYPDKLPLDTDNDLLILNDSITPAVGQVTHLTGRVLTATGEPVRNAEVEIWQADSHGAYLHSGSMNADRRDGNFQGFGRFLTGSKGEYYFRTIKPSPYPGRTPHIHFAINHKSERVLTTQCFVKGDPGNQRDGLLKRLERQGTADRVIVDFRPLEGSHMNELEAHFDIVLGTTPDDESHS